MTILGIETATDVCSAALLTGTADVLEEWVERKSVHAERLVPMIERLVRRGGISAADVNAVAVSIGPGSFTGLRIGLSVAKGLVYATGCALVAVPTLEALAARVIGEMRTGERVLAVLDARREEVYVQLFDVAGGAVVACGEPRDIRLGALAEFVGSGPVLVTGEARTKAASALYPENPSVRVADGDLARASAVSVVLAGRDRAACGAQEDPVTLEPRYIKEFFLRSGSPTAGV